MVCIEEAKLEHHRTQDWNMVGRGFLEGFLAVNANGQFEGIVVTWNETVLTEVDTRMGVKLTRQSDDFDVVMVSIYGPANAKRRAEL